MITPTSFTHIGLRSENVQSTVDFLQDFLEVTVLDEGSFKLEGWDAAVAYSAIELGDKRCFVVDPTPYEAAGIVESIQPGIAHFGIGVPHIEAAIIDWQETGGTVLMEPFTLDDTAYAFCAGPTGTRIELVEE